MSLNSLYNSKINILRVTKTSDNMGGWTEAKLTLHKNVPCRINWSSGSENIQFDKKTFKRNGKVFCDVIDITEKDILVYSGIEYEICNVSNVDNIGKFLTIDINLPKK